MICREQLQHKRSASRACSLEVDSAENVSHLSLEPDHALVGSLAAVAAIGWLAIMATGRRESDQEALLARQHALQVAGRFASSEILKEINRRFDILTQLASEKELREQMVAIDPKPSDEALWKKLEDWLGVRKADHARDAASDSWFINDARGVQVARSPRSEATRGENFAHRDYFHGQGTDLAADTKDLKPIKAPHLSAVYRSTSSGRLKVACRTRPSRRKAIAR